MHFKDCLPLEITTHVAVSYYKTTTTKKTTLIWGQVTRNTGRTVNLY